MANEVVFIQAIMRTRPLVASWAMAGMRPAGSRISREAIPSGRTAPSGGAASAASAQYQTGAQAPYQPQASFQQTGQQFAMAPAQDSFFANLMDTSRDFVNKFGKLVFLVAVIAILVNLIYGAYNEGRSVSSLVRLDGDYNALQFLLNLLANIPWALTQIGLVRLFIELVRNTSNRGA